MEESRADGLSGIVDAEPVSITRIWFAGVADGVVACEKAET